MTLHIGKLADDRRDWANQRWAEIDFRLSAPGDYIALAQLDGRPAGLGRLSALADGAAELGGMIVFPAFRGRGVATALIAHLLAQTGALRLYCLPFVDLRALYETAGFRQQPADASVPPAVLEKHAWCNRHYRTPVLLMRRG